jgi:hypothetical protein
MTRRSWFVSPCLRTSPCDLDPSPSTLNPKLERGREGGMDGERERDGRGGEREREREFTRNDTP